MLHVELKDAVDQAFADVLEEPVALFQDAMLIRLNNHVLIEARVANANEYSIAWRWMDAEMRIDTAPIHRELETFPNHLHDPSGKLQADPLTQPGGNPWQNLQAVIQALLEDPLLAAYMH